jgi:hypothetical protein
MGSRGQIDAIAARSRFFQRSVFKEPGERRVGLIWLNPPRPDRKSYVRAAESAAVQATEVPVPIGVEAAGGSRKLAPIVLPQPKLDRLGSLAEALRARRTMPGFSDRPLPEQIPSDLL